MGILLYFIGNLFITYSTYISCSFNFIFKYISISIITSIYYLHIYYGFKLGIKTNTSNKFNFSMSYYESDETENDINKLCSSKDVQNIDSNDQKQINNDKKNNDKKCDGTATMKNEIRRNKKFKSIRLILYKVTSFHLLFILFILLYPFLKKITNNEKNQLISIAQDKNKLWIYQCDLEKMDLLFSIIFSILYVILLIFGNSVSKYECIFFNIKYINYSLCVLLAIGPTTDVNIIYAYIYIYINRL